MQVLMYEPAYRRIADRLERAVPDLEPLLMQDDGSLRLRGSVVDAASTAPIAAWANSDLYAGGPLREFMIRCLKSPSLRFVQSSAAGFDHPVFAKLIDNGVTLSTSTASAISIAEFVMAAVLDAFHPQAERLAAQRERRWQRSEFREIYGTCFMIYGMGSIGREVALRARAFGAEVIGVRRTPRGDEPAQRMIAAAARQQVLEAAAESDVVVLCAAANSSSTHAIDAEFLARLGPSTLLINIARGALLDERALLEALQQGKPALAILDVFDQEPLPQDSALWTHPRVRVTAHTSAIGSGFYARGDALFLDNIARFASGKTPHFLADPSVVRGT